MVAKKEKTKKIIPQKADYHHGDLKRALLVAASEILEEVGYEGFSLRKCAARAGVSPNAPAHHFKDANGLLTSLAVEGFQTLSSKIRTKFLTMPKDTENPCSIASVEYLRFAKNNPALYKVMFGSRLDADYPDLKSATKESFESLRLSVSEFFPDKNSQDINAIAVQMWSSIHGLSMFLIEGRLNFLVGKDGFNSLSALEAAWRNVQSSLLSSTKIIQGE
ncbi:TetR/AcrR family transcriptional regulator [Leptospira sp. WS39.C2]